MTGTFRVESCGGGVVQGRALTSMASGIAPTDAVKESLKLLLAMRPHGLICPPLGRPKGLLPLFCTN